MFYCFTIPALFQECRVLAGGKSISVWTEGRPLGKTEFGWCWLLNDNNHHKKTILPVQSGNKIDLVVGDDEGDWRL